MSALANDLTSIGMAPALASRGRRQSEPLPALARRRAAPARRCVWWQCLPADHGIGRRLARSTRRFPVANRRSFTDDPPPPGLYSRRAGRSTTVQRQRFVHMAQNKTALIIRWSTVVHRHRPVGVIHGRVPSVTGAFRLR